VTEALVISRPEESGPDYCPCTDRGLWRVLERGNPRFAQPDADSVVVQPFVLLAEATRRPIRGGQVVSAMVPTGRIAALKLDDGWSIGVSGAVTPTFGQRANDVRDWLELDAYRLLFGLHNEHQRGGGDISWHGLLLVPGEVCAECGDQAGNNHGTCGYCHGSGGGLPPTQCPRCNGSGECQSCHGKPSPSTLLVLGVATVSELPAVARWLNWPHRETPALVDADPLSRAVWPCVAEMLGSKP